MLFVESVQRFFNNMAQLYLNITVEDLENVIEKKIKVCVLSIIAVGRRLLKSWTLLQKDGEGLAS